MYWTRDSLGTEGLLQPMADPVLGVYEAVELGRVFTIAHVEARNNPGLHLAVLFGRADWSRGAWDGVIGRRLNRINDRQSEQSVRVIGGRDGGPSACRRSTPGGRRRLLTPSPPPSGCVRTRWGARSCGSPGRCCAVQQRGVYS